MTGSEMGKQRKKPSKTKEPGKSSCAKDALAEALERQAVSAARMFGADADRLGGESPDVVAAVGYWIGYPLFLEWIGYGRDWSTRQETVAAYNALNLAHSQATRVLMKEAARRGLDPHALYECGRVVEELYRADPDLCIRRAGATYDTWPECMGTARYALPASQQDALRAGEAVFIRLAVAMDIAQAAPALTPDDRAVLQALADAETTQPQADIAAAAERDIKTIRERLKRLEASGLVSRPCGERSGFAITPSGLGLLRGARD